MQYILTREAKESSLHPWGCILSSKHEWYCDDCPVKTICPNDHKNYSK